MMCVNAYTLVVSENTVYLNRFQAIRIFEVKMRIILIILVVWLSSTVIRLENYHYANVVGMCDKEKFSGNYAEKNLKQYRCFETVQTRTHPLWHLYYALTDE